MASATTRPYFSFHRNSTTSQPSPAKPKTSYLLLLQPIPTTRNNYAYSYSSVSPLHHRTNPPVLNFITPPKSIDVSKEDKPITTTTATSSEEEEEEESTTIAAAGFSEEEDDGLSAAAEEEVVPRGRPEEKFAVLNTGIHECRSCGYQYNEAAGDPSYPVPPGLPFNNLPEDWRCATCGAAKSFFVSKSVEIAGFAENQQFGLGGNTLTSGQKAVLIYGSLLLGFIFFLSGYFLQ